MKNPFGPWATAMYAGRDPQLTTFWKRRVTMLCSGNWDNPRLSRRMGLSLVAAGVLVCALPTFRGAAETAEPDDLSGGAAAGNAGQDPGRTLNAPETVAALAAGVERRHGTYHNLKFVYTVKTEAEDSPELKRAGGHSGLATGGPLETRDVFKIMDSNRKSVSQPWRCWERYVRSDEDTWILDRFFGFDGSQFREFIRKNIDDRGRRWAVIRDNEDWGKYAQNPFDSFLFIDINGIARFMDPTRKVSHAMNHHFKITGRRKFQGREVYILQGTSSPEFGVDYIVHVTGRPDFMVLRWEAIYVKDKGQTVELYDVKQTKTFHSVVYPAKGYYRQLAVGRGTDWTYEFSVTSVEPLSDKARHDWFPKWPPGTHVVELIGDEIIHHVPRDVGR